MKKPIIREELNDVWLSQARKISLNDDNISEFYLRSGNRFIIEEITNYLKGLECDPQLVFFEHSYFATTLDENNYSIFTCIWNTEKLLESQIKKFLYFFSTPNEGLSKLEQIYPVLWHPEFFISGDCISFYISDSTELKPDLSFKVDEYVSEEYENRTQIHLVPNLQCSESVYVGNFPFTLRFGEAVKGIVEQKNSKARLWQPIEENNDRIRIAYDAIFDKKETNFSYKLSIPILGSPVDEKSEYVGQGSIWIYIISTKSVELEKLEILAQKIAGYFKDISINYIFQQGIELAEKAIIQATRAAISQDQARAGSHNIGSHVLSRLIADLFNYRFSTRYQSTYSKEDVDRLFDIQSVLHNELYSFESSENCEPAYNKWVKEKNTSLKLELEILTGEGNYDRIVKRANKEHLTNRHYKNLLHHQSKLNHYIKCRMDYLSDISFGIPAMQITKYLKSEIVSELDDVRLLLENISGLSNFNYTIEIECDFADNNNPAIAMPNDILGSQAFYNILENIIRNTAKHSNKDYIDDAKHEQQEDKIVKFTIQVEAISISGTDTEIEGKIFPFYQITIYDNINIPGNKDFSIDSTEKQEYITELKRVNGTELTEEDISKLTLIDYLVFCQNKKLNESILKKEDNTLRSTSLGLIEMEASACYLRKMDISLLESDEYQINYDEKIYNFTNNLNILKATAVSGEARGNKEKSKYLGYRFFVLKPTEVLLVGTYDIDVNLKSNGFLCLSFDELKMKLEAGEVFSHQFLIYDHENVKTELIDKEIDEENTASDGIKVKVYQSLLPQRSMHVSNSDFNAQERDPEKLLKYVWEKWGISNTRWTEKEIRNGVQTDSDNDFFCILNHAKSELKSHDLERFCKWFDDENNSFYIEALSSIGQQKLPYFSNSSFNPDNTLNGYINEVKFRTEIGNQIIESAYHKIVVIDERVQAAGFSYEYEGYKFYKYYRHCNIFIPSMEKTDLEERIDLGASNLDSKKENLLSFIDKHISNETSLLIHYSILERIYKNSADKQSKINKWLNEYATKTNVIVTSGRGIPPDLPVSVRFTNLSPVLAALIEYKSKYYLHQIIMSSRKSNMI